MGASEILRRMLPPGTQRRTFANALLAIKRQPATAGHRLNISNVKSCLRFCGETFSCTVCGSVGKPLFDFPDLALRKRHRIAQLRETLACRSCSATVRTRSLAFVLLGHLNNRWGSRVRSISELAQKGLGGIKVLDSDNFSPLSVRMKDVDGYIRCSYEPHRAMGTELSRSHFNIDLQRVDFPSASFDVVLTSDVLEHVRDVDAAQREIFRVLKPAGAHIFTAPYDPSLEDDLRLVDISGPNDIYLEPPHVHGDALTGGIVSYRVFGRSYADRLRSMGFDVEVRIVSEPSAMIVSADVFCASKPAAQAAQTSPR